MNQFPFITPIRKLFKDSLGKSVMWYVMWYVLFQMFNIKGTVHEIS